MFILFFSQARQQDFIKLRLLQKQTARVIMLTRGNVMVTFGTKLIELREFNKDTQEKLAEKLSISVQTLRRWEHDKNPPDINQLKLICEIYKVNPDYFFNEGTPDVKQTQITEGNEIGVSKDIWVQKKHKYIVAFGRSETVSGIYKNRYYHVNYGWRGYTDVTIMDNIFLNPIGSMYNLNPLG